MRAKFQLMDRPGMEVKFGTQVVFIHFVAQYKHLGTVFRSSHSMDQEISTRIGIAKSAFAQIAAPILCNRHLPEATRVRLFRALIQSRLFFGIGMWKTPTPRQLARIHAALVTLLRQLFRLKPEEITCTSAADLFQRAQICSPRARIAVDFCMHKNSGNMAQRCCSIWCIEKKP